MPIPRSLLAIVATTVAVVGPAALASGAARAPIRDCGDVATLDRGGFFNGAITAQATSCKNARAIATAVAKSAGCRRQGFCTRLGYHCLLAKAGKELTLVRCANRSETAFVRFEFGL